MSDCIRSSTRLRNNRQGQLRCPFKSRLPSNHRSSAFRHLCSCPLLSHGLQLETHTVRRRPQPSMTSDVTLRVAYFALNLVGGLVMTISFFVLCLNLRQTHDGPFLMSIVLCLSRIISTVTSCFLLFFGAMTGSTAPPSVCIAQSGLHASQGPLLAYSLLSYALNVLLMIPPSPLLMGTVATATRAGLLLLPLLSFAAVAVVSALIASQNPGSVYIGLLYCFLDHQDIKLCSAILSAIALLATIAIIARTLYIMKRKEPPLPASGTRWLEDIVLQILCLGLYAALRLGFLGVNTFKPDLAVAADMVDAADSIIIFIILATQPWLFKNWLKRMSPGAVDAPTHATKADPSSDRRHAAFLQRVSEYPSVIDIRRRRSGSNPGIEGGQQTPPRLRALSTALGLDPYSRYHVSGDLEKRATIVEPDFQHHPYSLDYAHNIASGSRPSPKSFEQGVAFGNSLRDTEATGNARPGTATPNDGRPTSLIIISTPPPGASSHALHLPLDEDTQVSEWQNHRASLSPLAIAGLNRLHRRSRGASDGSPSHTSFERSRRGQDSPLRATLFGISTESESASSGISPRGGRSVRTSLEPPAPHSSMNNYRYYGHSTSTGEGSMYQSTSSESSPHILVDDITSSVLSWPNISRSTSQLLQDRVDDVTTPASGGFSSSSSMSALRWLYHSGDSIEDPPHPAFLRETTPSPLSLNDEESVGHNTFGGPSPVERRHHPRTQGPSPLRPPGLGSPPYRWKEEIEEVARRESNES